MNTFLGFATCLSIVSISLNANELKFNTAKVVTQVGKGVFIHLDSSGRRNVAVSYLNQKTKQKIVAVTWEDNRNGKNTVYISFLTPGAKAFTKPRTLSQGDSAYEPTIVSLTQGRFLVAWEQSNKIVGRVVNLTASGKAVQLSRAQARQVSLAAHQRQVGAVWIEKSDVSAQKAGRQFYTVVYSSLKIKDVTLKKTKTQQVDQSSNRRAQLYPVLYYNQAGKIVGWEDRRQGATRMFVSFAATGKTFGAYTWINPWKRNPQLKYGRGIGAMRMGLAGDGKLFVAAVWMDKRNWKGGYDIYTAFSHNGGKTFGKAQLVQDILGANMPQWHGTVAVNPKSKQTITVWDDARDDTDDLWYSLFLNNAWSDDYTFTAASGPGKQSHPSVTYDSDGVLHLVWLSRSKGHMRLHYTHN